MQAVSQEAWRQVTGAGTDEAAKGLVVRFELQAVEDPAKSAAEGRPVFEDKEFIEIRSPNDPLSIVHREVEPKDRQTYPQLYKAWKEGTSDALVGTPLKEWPVIAKSQAEMLAFRGLRTVEQFADVSDDGCAQLGHGFLTLRNKAIAWLAKAKDASSATKMAVELQSRDVQIQDLQRQVRELLAMKAEAKEEAAPPKKAKS